MNPFRHALLWAASVGLIVPTAGRAAIPEEVVEQSVERGVAALRTLQAPTGHFGRYASGSTALAALALLECGVRPDDECIRKAADAIRADCPDLNQVYHLSL